MDNNLIQLIAVISTGLVAVLTIIWNIIAKYIDKDVRKDILQHEILLRKRLEAYERFLDITSNYVYTSGKDGKEYEEYLKVYTYARLLASYDTEKELKELEKITNKIRTVNGAEKSTIIQSDWHDQFEKVTIAMTNDLKIIKAN